VEEAVREMRAHFGSPATVREIFVAQRPTKTTYQAGEIFDPRGLVIRVLFDDGSEINISTGFTFDMSPIRTATTRIIVSFGGSNANVIITTNGTWEPPEPPKQPEPEPGGCSSNLTGGNALAPLILAGLLFAYIVLKRTKAKE
jgi:hypothetical protein